MSALGGVGPFLVAILFGILPTSIAYNSKDAAAARTAVINAVAQYVSERPHETTATLAKLLKAREEMLKLSRNSLIGDDYSRIWLVDEALLDRSIKLNQVSRERFFLKEMLSYSPSDEDGGGELYTKATKLFTSGDVTASFRVMYSAVNRAQFLTDPRDSIQEARSGAQSAILARYPDARRHFERSLLVNTDFKYGRLMLGMLAQHDGNIVAARSMYLSVLETPVGPLAGADTNEAQAAARLLLDLLPIDQNQHA